ncbi:MAG: two-component regulator propeller domain-containing protein [Bryobacteraceae bacterium]
MQGFRGLVAILPGVFCGMAAAGEPPVWMISQFNSQVWQIEQGLPHNYVTAIVQDGPGSLLIGTEFGLSHFDGSHFTLAWPSGPPAELLRTVWIASMLRASDGTLWVGGYRAGLHAIRPAGLKSYGAADGITEETVFSTIETRSHDIWFTSSRALHKIDRAGAVHTVRRFSEVIGYEWQTLSEDEKGAIWFASPNGVLRIDAAQLESVSIGGLEGKPVAIYALSHRRFYLGTTKTLYLLSCTESGCSANAVPEVKGPVVGIRLARDNSLWVATWGQGLYRVSDGRVEHAGTREGLGDDFVRTIFEDDEGNVWIGTRSGGLTRFSRTLLRPFGMPEGLGGNYASAAADDGEGGVWLGTWRSGLFHWDNSALLRQPLPEDDTNVLIRSLAVDSRRRLWIGTDHRLWLLDSAGKMPTQMELAGESAVSAILAAKDGSLWIGRDNGGLVRFASGDPRTSAGEAILADRRIATLLEDANGQIWAGATDGAWRIPAGGKPERIGATNGSVSAISCDSRGRIWIALTGGALYVSQGGRLQRISAKAGFPLHSVYRIVDDRFANLWVSTGRGIFSVPLTQVDALLAGKADRVSPMEYGVLEGMRTIECHGVSQPPGALLSSGELWLPTAKGFVAVNTRQKPAGNPLHPVIQEITLDGQKVTAGAVDIPSGTHRLQVRFSALYLNSPGRVRFRYRLEGFDPDWIPSDADHVALYARLIPGHFAFLVSARLPDGQWSPALSFEVNQRPGFTETIWFYLSLAAGLTILCAGAYSLWLRAVRRRYSVIAEERERIAREWHDTLLTGLSAVSWQLQAVSAKWKEAPSPALESLRMAAGMLRHCQVEARRVISELRGVSANQTGLLQSVKNTVDSLTAGTGVRATVESREPVPAISADLESNFVSLCHEATINALRHAHASAISVTLGFRDGIVYLEVEDNGEGMDPAYAETPPAGHFGLLGMRERAHRFGGKLRLTSQRGRGTRVHVSIPVASGTA